jgi:phospholipid transport system substrate-binding protein
MKERNSPMKCTLSLIIMVFAGLSPRTVSSDPLVDLIKSKNEKLQQLLSRKSQKDFPQRDKKIKELISSLFDFQEMGRKSLSRRVYDSLTAVQRKQFVEAFKEMLENTSIKKLELYKADSTFYDEPVYNKNKVKAKVTAHTFMDGQESVVVYKMFLKNGRWRGWDLVIDDLHTTRNYKTLFDKILKKKTFQELIKLLEDKARSAKQNDKKGNANSGAKDSKADQKKKQ